MWNGKQKAITFSYDDGVEQDERLVALFNQYGVKCTFNLNSQLNKECAVFQERTSGLTVARLPENRLRSLYAGHEVASHGLTHLNPVSCTDEELARELDADISSHRALFGTDIVGYAYPFGSYDDRVVSALAARGIRYARTVECDTSFALPSDPLRLKASYHHAHEEIFEGIERFLKADTNSPMLLYIWGHSYEFDVNNNWDRIESILRLCAGHDEIFYGTNAQTLLDIDNSVRA